MALGNRSEHVAHAAELREAGAGWAEIGKSLRDSFDLGPMSAMRLAHGWSQARVADEWNQRWPDSPISPDLVYAWESWATPGGHGRPKSSNPPPLPRLERLAELYACSVSDLVEGLADFRHLDAYPDPVNRRTFLGAASFLAAGALLPLDLTRQRVGASDVARLRDDIGELFALDDAQGGASVYERALQQLTYVRRLLDETRYGTTVGRDLQIVAGELTEMAGWSAFDAGQQTDGRRLFTEALTAGHVTGSAPLSVLVMASMSLQASSFGSGREAVELAQAAQRLATPYASARLLSLLSAREGLGHARAGDASPAYEAFVRSEQLLDDADDPREDWLAFWGPADFHGAVALAHLHLGDARAAERSCRDALALTPAEYPRNRSLYGGQLAEALLEQNAIDEGADAATQAASGVCSGRLRHQLRTLRPRLEPHAGRPAVDRCLRRLAAVA